MRLRLRHLTSVGTGGVRAVREELVDVEAITIGRSTESVVFLSELTAALHHAVIHLQDGRLWIETVDGDAVRVGGRVTSGRSLAVGDTIRVGRHELRIVSSGDDDSDVTVDIDVVELGDAVPEDLAARTRLGIERGLLARRPLSLVLAGGVVLAFLVGPLLSAKTVEKEPWTPGEPELATWQRLANTSWSSGPVSSPHRHFAERCSTCHLVPFETVPDRACSHCHADSGGHLAGHETYAATDTAACTHCHQEHRGDAALLAALGDGACLDCHASPGERFPEAGLQPVGDFAGDHAQFRLALPGGEGGGAQLADGEDPRRASAAKFVRVEGGGLRFPHDKHLVADLRAPDGPTQLDCGSCHATDDGGVTMQGMTFEGRCASCHLLAFDTAEPSRQVAHRDSDLVRRELFEYYAARAARGEAELVVVSERRRPGRETLVDPNPATARWIAERTAAAEDRLFGDEGICRHCHVIEDDALVVQPVRVGPFADAGRWLPRAEFPHRPHRSAQCNLCHDANSVTDAATVMMPGIGVCRGCHGGLEPAAGRLASPCSSCHDYHREVPGDRATARAVAIPEGGDPS